jgi:hypothetical protein
MVGTSQDGSQAAVAQEKSLRVAEVRMEEKEPWRRELKAYGYVEGLAVKESDGQQVGLFFSLDALS